MHNADGTFQPKFALLIHANLLYGLCVIYREQVGAFIRELWFILFFSLNVKQSLLLIYYA